MKCKKEEKYGNIENYSVERESMQRNIEEMDI